MGHQNGGFPSKTGHGRVRTGNLKRKHLLVIGKTPDETADDVTDPEDGLYQHRFVIFFANPVILEFEK